MIKNFQSVYTLDTNTGSIGLPAKLDYSYGVLGPSSNYGRKIAAAGDLNNDGFDDYFVSGFDLGVTQGSIAYLIYGSSNPEKTLFLRNLDGKNGVLFYQDQGDPSPPTISKLGDINGDKIDDAILGFGQSNLQGNSYIIFGGNFAGTEKFDVNLLNGINGFKITGTANGQIVCGIGDFDNDGLNDFAVRDDSNRSKIYIVRGSKDGFGKTFDLSTITKNQGLIIETAETYGYISSLSGAGDLNNDKFNDIVLAETNRFGEANYKTYSLFGNNNFDLNFNLTNIGNGNGFIVDYKDPSAISVFRCVRGGFNFNGDEYDDFVFIDTKNPKCPQTGIIVFGNKEFNKDFYIDDINGKNGMLFYYNPVDNAQTYYFIANIAGDYNNDGLDDLLFGSYPQNNYDGGLVLVFGNNENNASLNSTDINGSNGFNIKSYYGDRWNVGSAFGEIGDINNDTITDIGISAPGADWQNFYSLNFVLYGESSNGDI